MFLSIRNYINEFNERSDFSVVFHVNYKAAVVRSYDILKAYRPSFQDCHGKPFSMHELDKAHEELMCSYLHTLSGHGNPFYTCAGVYQQVLGADGKIIPGIKLYVKDDILHLEGYRLHKKVLRPGEYPISHSSSFTMAKNFLRTKTPVEHWGQWRLSVGKFDTITVGGISITDQQVIRQVQSQSLRHN